MKIIITGGTGFIGSHLLHRLAEEKEHKLFVLTRFASDISRIQDIKDAVTIMQINTNDDLKQVFKKNSYDVIIHLATTYIKYEKSTEEIMKMNGSNITFPSVLLQLAIEHGVKTFINTGTCFEYKVVNHAITEEAVIEPYNYYAATKVAFENLLRYHSLQKRIKAISLKLFYPYGEKDNEKFLVQLIKALLKNQQIAVSKGEQALNFTYISDIVDAYEKAISYICSATANDYSVFNIGQSEVNSIKRIGKLLEEITNKKGLLYFTQPYAKNEIMFMKSDCTKAKNTLQWEAKVTMREGLERMVKYYSQL